MSRYMSGPILLIFGAFATNSIRHPNMAPRHSRGPTHFPRAIIVIRGERNSPNSENAMYSVRNWEERHYFQTYAISVLIHSLSPRKMIFTRSVYIFLAPPCAPEAAEARAVVDLGFFCAISSGFSVIFVYFV